MKVKIMSYNIRYMNGADKHKEMIAGGTWDCSWETRVPQVVSSIRKQDPDIFGLQEATYRQYKDIRDNFKDYKSIFRGREDGRERGEGVPVFWKKDKWIFLGEETFWLIDRPDSHSYRCWSPIPRIATRVSLCDASKRNHVVHVLNTHLDHETQLARAKSATLIKDKLKHFLRNVVVMGDMNEGVKSAGVKSLLEIFKDTRNHVEGEFSFHDFQGENYDDSADRAWAQDLPVPFDLETDIDFILTSETGEGELIKDEFGLASDHYPVVAIVTFQSNPEDVLRAIAKSKSTKRRKFCEIC